MNYPNIMNILPFGVLRIFFRKTLMEPWLRLVDIADPHSGAPRSQGTGGQVCKPFNARANLYTKEELNK